MMYVDIDRAKAQALNITPAAIFNTLQAHLGSYYVNDFNRFSKTYQVKLQADSRFRENINAIKQLYVPSTTGHQIPMDAVATVRYLGLQAGRARQHVPCNKSQTQSVPFFIGTNDESGPT